STKFYEYERQHESDKRVFDVMQTLDEQWNALTISMGAKEKISKDVKETDDAYKKTSLFHCKYFESFLGMAGYVIWVNPTVVLIRTHIANYEQLVQGKADLKSQVYSVRQHPTTRINGTTTGGTQSRDRRRFKRSSHGSRIVAGAGDRRKNFLK
ncbi:unnamed protein product, partial [Rotaria magnacalcarata]